MLAPRFEDTVDLMALYQSDDRPAPADRPWVLLNMVATADGATAVDGRSASVGGGDADRAAFAVIRSVADVILVGAGTVRAERYGPPKDAPEAQAARKARGQAAVPRIAVVSASLDLDLSLRLFAAADDDNKPVVVTATNSDADRLAAMRAATHEVIATGTGKVDLALALRELRRGGAAVVLCEGGPSLNGQLVAHGLVDELCLTITPALAAGASARLAHGSTPGSPTALALARVVEHEGVLLLRYVRR